MSVDLTLLNEAYNTPRENFDESFLTPQIGNVGNSLPQQTPADKVYQIALEGQKNKKITPSTYRPISEVVSDRYPSVTIDSINMEDVYGESQSSISKAFNGTVKGLNLVGTTFLQSTVGLVNGVGAWVNSGDFSSFYNNEFNNALDQWNKSLEDELPNYYTDVESNSEWYSPKNLFTANFLWDKIVKNLGYAGGAALAGMGTGAVLRSIGAAARSTALGSGIEAISAIESGIAAGEQLPNIYSRLAALTQKVGGINNILNKGYRATVAGLATTGEAGMEALQATNEYRDSLIEEYKTNNGIDPSGLDLKEINNKAEEIGDLVFKLNVGLLSATNYVQFPKILGSSFKNDKAFANLNPIKRVGEEFVEDLPTTRFGKLARGAKNISSYIFSPAESFEELSQFAISTGVENYFDRKFSNENPSILKDLFGYGYQQAFSEKEGIESILIGGLSGGLMTAYGTYKDKQERSKETKNAIGALNKYNFRDFIKDTSDSIVRSNVTQKLREQAIRQGDILESKDLDTDYAINYVANRIKYGRFDLVQEDINNYKSLASSEEGFLQLQNDGIASILDTKDTFLARLENFENLTKNINQSYSILNLKYGSIIDKNGKNIYTKDVIDKLVYANAKIVDYNKRIPELASSLMENGILVGDIITSISQNNTPNTQAVIDVINQINNLNNTDDFKNDLKQELQDVIELALRKNKFIKDYNDIVKHPEKYKDIDFSTPIKIGEEELNIGEEYKVAPFSIEGGVFTLNPTISVLNKTLGNEYQVVDSNGNIQFLTKENLKEKLKNSSINIDDNSFNSILNNTFKNLNLPALDSLQDKINYINENSNDNLLNQIERDINEYINSIGEIQKNKKVLDTFEENQKTFTTPEEVSTGIDEDVEIEAVDFDPVRKRPLSKLFNSTTYNRASSKEYIAKQQFFFRNVDNLPQDIKNNLKMIIVTNTNQSHLGLNGIIDYMIEGTTIDKTNSKETPILTLAVVQKGSDYYYIDYNGNILNKIGIVTDFNELVFGTLPTNSLKWNNGDLRYSNASKEQADIVAKQWGNKREALLKMQGTEIYDFEISKGIPEKYPLKENGTKDRSFITDSLINKSIISNQSVVAISNGNIDFQEQSYYIPAGRPYLKYGSTLEALNNRKHTKEEANLIFELLKRLTTKPSLKSKELNFLNGLIFWKPLLEGKQAALSNQVYLSKGLFYFGNSFNIPFTEEAFEKNKESIKEFFVNSYNNISSAYLKNLDPFEEIIKINEDGTLETRTWNSYQEYLISDTVSLIANDNHKSNGSKRIIANMPLTTTVRAINKDIPLDTNYYYKSATLTNSSDGKPLIEIPKETKKEKIVKQKEQKQNKPKVSKTETFTNVYSPIGTGEEYELTYNATLLDNGEVNIVFEENENYKKAINAIPDNIIDPHLSDELTREDIGPVYLSSVLENIAKRKLTTTEVKKEETPVEKYTIEIIAKAIINGEDLSSPEALQFFENNAEAIEAYLILNKEQEEAKKEEPKKEPTVSNRKSKRGSGQYRTSTKEYGYILQNIDKEEKEVKRILNTPIKRLKNIIRTTDGGYAWGMFKDGVIYIYENAETGTLYHEAFEAVWGMFTDYNERNIIIKEFKSREGTFIDRATNKSILYKNATEFQIKEQLAEEFRDYMLTETAKSKNAIYSFFKELWNFIKNLFNTPVTDIEGLFKKINSGYYKTQAPKPSNVTTPQYREVTIGKLSIADSYKTVRGITAELIQLLLNSNRSLIEFDSEGFYVDDLFDDVFNDLALYFEEDIYLPELFGNNPDILNSYSNYWNELKNNKETTKQLVKEYLSTFNLKQVEEKVDEESSSDEDSDETYQGSKNSESYVRDVFKYDGKLNSSASVKLLFSTMVKSTVDEKGNLVNLLDPATQMSQLADFSKSFNFVMNQLYTANTPEEKWKKLEELKTKDVNFIRLYNRLKLQLPPESLTLDDWKLRTKFFSTFSKQRPEGKLNNITKEGSFIQGENLNSSSNSLAESWVNNWKINNSDLIVIGKEGEFRFNAKSLSKLSDKTVEDKLELLKVLEIPFTEELYENLNKKDQETFRTKVSSLLKYLKAANNKAVVNVRSLNVKGSIESIATLYLKSSNESFDSTFFDINGNRRQQFINTNTFSSWINDINNAKTIDALYNVLPNLNTPYSKDSYIVNNVLFNQGSKTNKKLKLDYISGVIGDNKKTSIERLSLNKRKLLEINNNIIGNYYVLVPADSATEWMINLGNQYKFEDFQEPTVWDKLTEQFNVYYKTEKQLGGKGLLYEVTNSYEADELTTEQVKEFINKQAIDLFTDFSENNILKVTRKGYTIPGLNTDFGLSIMDRNQIAMFFNFVTANYIINNIEMHKLFFGNPTAIKDPLKRYKSFLSPRETSYYGDVSFNNAMNIYFNKNLKKNNYGYWEFKDYMRTVTMDDLESFTEELVNDENIPTEYREKYAENNGTDAQSWAFAPAYREILLRSGRFTNEQIKKFDYLMALDRLAMAEDGINVYKGNPNLKKLDLELQAKGSPNNAIFSVLKPIGTGYTLDNNLFLDKTSLAPLFYTWVRNTNMKEAYLKMYNQNISYLIVKSGRKIGSNKLNTFYNADGTLNTNEFEDIIDIPFKYYGIQVETEKDSKTTTLGTQLSKDIYLNLLNNGVPFDYKGNNWDDLKESVKLKNSEIYRKVKYNINILTELQKNGYNNVLDTFGIVDNGEYFTIENKEKLLKVIKSELFRREAPQNIKMIFSLENGELTTPIEATSVYEQVKNILYSYVEKNIARPALTGGAKVQLSGSMFEVGDRKVKVVNKNGKQTLVSNGLKFYSVTEWKVDEQTGKKLPVKVNKMEVLIPNWFKAKLQKANSTLSDEDIIAYLNDPKNKEGQEILTGIGFRIPTQELNSIDAFVVKGFLPDGMGSTIVVPEALTTKSGSDFDVDKLNTYLKNIYIDKKGYPRLMKFWNINPKNKEELEKFYNYHLLDKYLNNKKNKTKKEIEAAIDNLFGQTKEENNITKIPSLEEFILEASKMNVFELNKKYNKFDFKLILENEYFNSIEELIVLPDNFMRLIKPNSNKPLKDLYKELVAIAPNEFDSKGSKSVLNRSYMNFMRHAFIVGKGGVGIAAVRQTNSALSQLGKIGIDLNRFNLLPSNLRKFVKPHQGILLEHKSFERGGVSYPTFSSNVDTDDVFISDKNSQYIDGYVDIAKDPFIIQLGATTELASTFLVMEGLGISMRNTIMFMNQPIIREYIKWLTKKGTTWLYNDNNIKNFKRELGFIYNQKQNEEVINSKTLKNNIEKYYNGGIKNLTKTEIEEQSTILDQFLQFKVIADEMRTMVQGTTYDTDISADPNLNYRKETSTNQTLNKSLFIGVQDIFDKSFIGNQRKLSGLSSRAISSSVFALGDPAIRKYMLPVIDKVMNTKGVYKHNYIKFARQIEQSFLTYLVNTDRKINTNINRLMVNAETSLAKNLIILKNSLPADSDLKNNVILNNLIPYVKNNTKAVKNITIIDKVTDPYSSDVYTSELRELRDNPITSKLYDDIIILSFLQSGVGRSSISLTEYIPSEDYATLIKPTLDRIKNFEDLDLFNSLDVFYRNSWNNTTIVPVLDEQFNEQTFVSLNQFPSTWYTQLKTEKNISQSINTPIKILKSKSAASANFITFNKSFDYNLASQGISTKMLMKRLVNPITNEPVEIGQGDFKSYIYYPVNAWGDSFRLQEYYNILRKSEIVNGYAVIDEIPMEEVFNAFQNRNNEKNNVSSQDNTSSLDENKTKLDFKKGPCK